jgi:hypothetical protein
VKFAYLSGMRPFPGEVALRPGVFTRRGQGRMSRDKGSRQKLRLTAWAHLILYRYTV